MPRILLLADESTTIQRVVELTFAGEDVRVVAVSDGEEAMAEVQRDAPDIVLADIAVPKRNGYEVSAFIKRDAALRHIPVLLLAGAFEPVDEERARQAGCDGVLIKPFEPREMIARVFELLDNGAAVPVKAASATPRPVDRPVTAAPPLSIESPRPPSQPLRLVPVPPKPPGPPTGSPSQALDDYFDQLDAAFAARAVAVGLTPSDDSDAPAPDVPVMGPLPGASEQTSREAPPIAAETATIEEAFAALLAAEQGAHASTRVAKAVRSAPPIIDDGMIEDIARRVAERLGAVAVRDVVADVVSDVAERLVRDEIDRIRRGQTPGVER